jgi:hypothetical protein
MLIASQLYIQHHLIGISRRVEPLPQHQISPGLVSHAPSAPDNPTELRTGIEKNPSG